jgi:hypothetical protein
VAQHKALANATWRSPIAMVFEEDCLFMIWLQVDDNRANALSVRPF